jgi:hypothetical protein
MYVPLKVPPGVFRNGTQYQSAGRWYDSNLVRWFEQTLRPIGGWEKRLENETGTYLNIQVNGVMRGSHSWRDNAGNQWLAAGGSKNLYIIKASKKPYDITPYRDTGTLTNAFSTTSGSAVVVVADTAHGSNTGDTVNFTNGTAIGSSGITLSGNYIITKIDVDSYTVTASGNAASTEANKGSADYKYQINIGYVDSQAQNGFGTWLYGQSTYGTPRPQFSATGIIPASTWALDNWGEYLLACRNDDGKIYEWTLNTANRAAIVTNAPTGNSSILVTPERFVFALGAGGNPRKVQWCDQEDNTDWSPSATNQAGDFELSTSGKLICGERTRYGSLLLTTVDAHLATYQGPPYVYGFERIGFGCGVISAQASVSIDNGAVWMSDGVFYLFDGAIKPLQCDVSDYVFSDFNYGQAAKVAAVLNSEFFEVTWFYPSGGSSECDRYVSWNFRENVWYFGTLARTTGVPAGVFQYPIMFDPSGYVYDHEVGYSYDGAAPYAESGPVEFGNGDRIMVARQVLPDEKIQGQVNVTFKTRFAPEGVESTYGPYTISAQYTDVRFSGRQVSYKVTGVELGDWRVGNFRLEAVPGARR